MDELTNSGEVVCCLCGLFCPDDLSLRCHIATSHRRESVIVSNKDFYKPVTVIQHNPSPPLPPAAPPPRSPSPQSLAPAVVIDASMSALMSNFLAMNGHHFSEGAAAAMLMLPFESFVKNLAVKVNQQIIAEAFSGRANSVINNTEDDISNEQPSTSAAGDGFVVDGSGVIDMTTSNSNKMETLTIKPVCLRSNSNEENCHSSSSSSLFVKMEHEKLNNPAKQETSTEKQQDEKRHLCPFCGKAFRLKQTLLVHKRVHTGEKPYQCPLCPARFSHATNRKSHIRTHTKQRPFTCETCGRGFTRKFSLSLHRLRHVNSFPFKCDICDKRFRRADIFRTHTFGHAEKFRFQCFQCSTRFSTKISLRTHLLKAHAIKTTPPLQALR